MGITLVIEEEKFGTDELGRNTTLLTQIYSNTINSEMLDIIVDVIREEDKQDGYVEYMNEDSMDYEVYGSVINSILSEIARCTNNSIAVVGGIDNNQLYKVSMSL